MVSSGVKCVKWLIFVFNFLFFLTGCGLIGIGVWLNVDRDDWEGISDYDYISVANVIIAAGAIIIVIAFLGCCGAITENKIMLLFFFIFLLIIFILELGAGIAAYVWRGEIDDELQEQLEKRIPDRYTAEEGVRKAVDAVQKEFDCCGVHGVSDWQYKLRGQSSSGVGDIPQSCCKKAGVTGHSNACIATSYGTANSQYYQEGCYKSIQDFLEDNLLYVGICGIIFAVFQVIRHTNICDVLQEKGTSQDVDVKNQILGMVFAMVLYCALRKESQTV